MSKINAVRFINLNYNNNAIRISDETFWMNGESTLLSLRNGGGKSVLVQMIMAPFVHKRYQNAKDRPFSSYFTTNKPTFILVEWKLDRGAGYVLTGMMVRRNQENTEEHQEELEIVNFIAEYKERCSLDICHLPVVEKTGKEVILKGFHVCRQLFEGYKRDRSIPFFHYDMNNAAQSKQYFDKLMEYQINYREWESIIKKVNLKESGLSDLFADCKDEKGLVEKWFLDAVESKLNRDKNRIKEFQAIMEKYTGLYKDNQSKIERKDTIRAFERETERIKGSALEFQEASEMLEAQKARVADFIGQLHRLNQKEEEKAEAAQHRKAELEQKLEHLEYEKLSAEIYDIRNKEHLCGSNLEMLKMEEGALEREMEEISYRLQTLFCAKQQENVKDCEDERDKERQRLALCLEKEENLQPERRSLGAQLKKYYEGLHIKIEAEKERCRNAAEDMAQEKKKEEELLEELRQTEGELSEQAGSLSAKAGAFDDAEDRFNQEYQENWRRNILGRYESGALQIYQAEYEKQLIDTKHARIKTKKEAEVCREEQKSIQRLLEEQTADKIRLEAKKGETENLLLAFERELKERSVILQYFEITQPDLFDMEKIVIAAERKLSETDMARQCLEKEADVLEKEYRRMAQGQILELSEEFAGMLAEAGIHFVYGMEWLKKNQYTVAQNKKLVMGHPFLPYSLIVSSQELKRLAGLPEHVYTSFPVPILIREELDQKKGEQRGTICSFTNVNFYVWFNDSLLEEEKLKQVLSEKEIHIKKLQKSISQKKLEYTEYIGRLEKIKNQRVSRGVYETAEGEIRRQELELSALDQEILQRREEQERQGHLLVQKEAQIAELDKAVLYQERRLLDFSRLCQSYEEYRETSRLLEKNKKDRERCLNQQKLKKERICKLEQELITVNNSRMVLERDRKECEEKQLRYQQYPSDTEEQMEEVSAKEGWLGKAESRYEAITSGIGAEQKELEERAEAAERRYAKALEELKLLQEKYDFKGQEWSGVRYDRKEEKHQETLLEEQEQKLSRKRMLIHQEEITLALLKQERENKYTDLRERCQKETPIARKDISTVDFREAIKSLEYEKGEVEREEKQIQKKIQSYESNLVALAEYEEFTCTETVEWEIDFSAMTSSELTRQKGYLIRDYNNYMEQRRAAQAEVERAVNQVIRMEQFAGDFYQKPLESMLQLANDARRIIRQLETTIDSYNSLMEKLLVDISMVEKEKKKIAELLGDYLKEVHENLNKIDHNSTIIIRERPVKMLKIELPDWTENESFYELRLQDYMDETTTKGIALLEENKNIQEFLGAKVTTRELYDAVVGIGNVQIRLYKIEEQREYPISWADVARNSGGEGFLSAFVILSALIYYMRRDDMDIFADRREGKVLLMDNPFAQTNASHLLKPLMDMAKKTDTQLICLSGIGGESIYNRFDNIYVLTLLAANLRNNMQYLKAEHMKGSMEETLLVARVEVMEQQELLF